MRPAERPARPERGRQGGEGKAAGGSGGSGGPRAFDQRLDAALRSLGAKTKARRRAQEQAQDGVAEAPEQGS